jgi:hypothetical protein
MKIAGLGHPAAPLSAAALRLPLGRDPERPAFSAARERQGVRICRAKHGVRSEPHTSGDGPLMQLHECLFA